MLIIGSTALKHHFANFNRKPKDLDYAVADKSLKSNKEIEYLYNPVILEWAKKTGSAKYLSPRGLLTLKMSHIFFHENQFDKTMWDIQHLVNNGVEYDRKLFDDLYDFWPTILGKNKRSNLDMNSKDFFDNAINGKLEIEHDEIHEILEPDGPTYKKILVGQVKTCDEKFNNLNFTDKVKLISAETCVMAAERYQGEHWRNRYSKQLKKMILGHLTIEESIFAIINYPQLNIPYFGNYMKTINKELRKRRLNELV